MEPQSPFDLPSDEPAEPAARPASPFAHDPEPRLGIVHLLGWTGFTAVFLGLQEFLTPSVGEISASSAYAVMRVAWGLGAGVAVGSLWMMAVRRWRGIPFPNHPGEFLLVLYGLVNVLTIAGYAASVVIGQVRGFWSLGFLLILPQFAVVMLTAIWAFQKLGQRHWRVLFVLLAVVTVLHTIRFFMTPLFKVSTWLPNGIWLAMPCLLAYAVFRDKRTGQRRPWTHWLGTALLVWYWLTRWILPLLVRFT